ncbi:MAG: sodium-dependent bicarbonate transport family permease [Acidimicrobiales bacterium]
MYSFRSCASAATTPLSRAAIAGTYGSVSAVTFITAQQFLARKEPSSAATWRWRWC